LRIGEISSGEIGPTTNEFSMLYVVYR
jgi:hypothetical protein